jgi:hypothetical protein
MQMQVFIKTCLPATLLPLLLMTAGCVTKTDANARVREAYSTGRKQGAASQLNSNMIWVVGNVQNPNIPWTDDLTLAKAIIAANYLNPGDPGQIVLRREGIVPRFFSAQQLLYGFDMPLEPGDIIELRK